MHEIVGWYSTAWNADGDDRCEFLDKSWADYFIVELHAVEARIDPPPDTEHIADVTLRARRIQRKAN